MSPAAIVNGSDRPTTPSWIAGSNAPFGSGWKSSVSVPAPALLAAASRLTEMEPCSPLRAFGKLDREHGMR